MAQDDPAVDPRVDPRVSEAVAEVLGTRPAALAADDNLIRRGLDSIRTMALLGRWRAQGAEVDYAELAREPTLAAWSRLLAERRCPGARQPHGEHGEQGEQGGREAGQAPRDGAGRAARSEDAPFPLTPVQQAYWLGRGEGRTLGGNSCHAYMEFDGHGVVPDRLEDAVREVVARHAMLRAVFAEDGTQRIAADSAWPGLTVHDLRELTADQARERLESHRELYAHRRFPLASGPLFDVQLSLLPEGATRVHFDIDLLIADVLSIQLLLGDLARAYARPGSVTGDAGPAYSFPRYLADLETHRAADRDKARAYWQERLHELPPGPRLPVATDPATLAAPRFTRRTHRLAASDWEAFARHARAHELTPSMALAAAYAAVLGAWSDKQHFALNLPLFDRQPLHPDVHGLVADFTNLVLVTADTGQREPFARLAARLQARTREDVTHAAYSAVDVLRDVARARPQESYAAPVVFACNLGGPFGGAFVGEEFRTHLGEFGWMLSQTPQVWLDHQVYEDRGELLLAWDAVEELFPDGVLDAMFDAYSGLLTGLARVPAAWDAPLPGLVPATQLETRAKVNSTAAPEPQELLHQGAVAAARRAPGDVALRWDGGTMTHGELLRRALAVADVLTETGHRRGDRVAVVMDKGWEQVAAVLGVLLADGVYVPIDTNQPPARRATVMADAGTRRVLTQSWLSAEGWPPGTAPLAVDTLEPVPEGTTPPPAHASREDLAYVIYTSGSTGRPKGVMISHRSAVNTLTDINSRYGVCSSDRVLALAALGFDLSVWDVFGVLAAGGCLVLPDPARRADPSHWADLAARHRVTLWNSVPAQLQMLEHYLSSVPDLELPVLRLALLSGDWIPVTLPDSVRERIPGVRLVSLGGATEAAVWSIHHPIGEVPAHWRSIPYGTPLTNQTFHVLDPALRQRPEHVPGELWIGGTGVALGYLGDQERTAERFVIHPDTGERLYRTGDLGRWLPDGTIEFLGREDSQVKVRGHRIELAEIESALLADPRVGSAVVTVLGESTADRTLAAVVTGAPAHPDPPDTAGLLRSAATAGRQALPARRSDGLAESVRLLNGAGLAAMTAALRETDAFPADGTPVGAAEILRRTGTVPRAHRVVRRWLTALTDAGLLGREAGTGRYHCLAAGSRKELSAAWKAVEEHEWQAGYTLWPPSVLTLFRTSMERLPELMRGEEDQVRLLFPDGGTETAQAAFADNDVVRYLNRAAAGLAARLAATVPPHRPLRVLEIGAGVGATTRELVPALAPSEPDYLFTDVSQFFLTTAREEYADRPWMRFGLFDINADHRAQGYGAQSFDLIVAANVLHNARHIGRTLDRLRELLAPGGWLVLTELTADRPELMTSMEFLVRLDGKAGEGADFEDLRKGRDQTFFDAGEWSELLTRAGAEAVLTLPDGSGEGGGPVAFGQHLIAATFKRGQHEIPVDDLFDHLADRLPDYMIPDRLEPVDALPLSPNGKVDRKTVASWLADSHRQAALRGAPPRDALERRLAQEWEAVLAQPEGAVARDSDFFALGGDSLLAAQLVARLRAEVAEAAAVPFEDLLRALLRTPTVAALASELRTTGARA
ncbi:amino acid adenylation domain-containing protein [Streptomyces sp. NPDC048172]|uniref:non-ribosomal peptide synthetase n=1 Tax=Streptomyces sp. NPDC048172 TaxID=3365505 RepID=UPI003723DBC3